ncbi:MAG: LLM class flavin-dependent oxidoreductase [Candidatus Dormibacteraeota bacterium]|nr:LLM class flavin-dependent oxidoreductase [Candidatus Dormibacteraeota bacterium]
MTEVGLGLRGDLPPAAYRELGAAAEAGGFDVLSVFGDLGFGLPLPGLLLAAAETTHIRLGPACLNPYTTHPVEIAGQVAALDHLSGGRAYLGLARGAWLEQAGLETPRPVRTIREAHEVVSRLLAGDDRGFEGLVYHLEPGLRLHQPVLRPAVPLMIGTWGEKLTELAAVIADELKVGGSASPAMAALARARLGEARTAVVMGAVTVVDEDGSRARQAAKADLAMYLDVVGGLDPSGGVDPDLLSQLRKLMKAGDRAAAAALIPDDVLRRYAFAGTSEDVAAKTEELFAAGVLRVEFGLPLGVDGVAKGLQLLSREVLPRLPGHIRH